MTGPSGVRGSAGCDLCGLPLIGRPIRDDGHSFCCEGCRRVWTTAERNGLTSLLCAPSDRARRNADASQRKAQAAAAIGAQRETLRIEGMWCSSCALVVEDAVLGIEGVLDAEVSYAASLARITWDPGTVGREALLERIGLLGYGAESARLAESDSRDAEDTFLRFFVAAVISMWVMWPTIAILYPAFARGEYAAVRPFELLTGGLSLVVLLYPGWVFIAGAWRAARVGRVTMDTLVVLGTWTAWLYSAWAVYAGAPTYFESAAMITGVVLFGRWLESLGQRDATRAVAALASAAAPEEAWLLPDGAVGGIRDLSSAVRVPIGEVTPGAVIVVRAGERVPVDGAVLEGTSDVDVARLTGEPMPATVSEGDEVWAGSINLTTTLVVTAHRVGADTLGGRLAAVAEDAVFAKSRTQRLADAIAAVFVPLMLAVAAATLLITAAGAGLAEGVSRAVAVLVVACPCALGLATPLAAVNAVGAGARRNLLVRGGPVFERAGVVGLVAFDKTGTLTLGQPSAVAVHPEVGFDDARVLDTASALEATDPHPVAQAIRRAASARGIAGEDATDAVREPGRGVSGTVGGVAGLVGSESLLASRGVTIPAPLAERARTERAAGRVVVFVARGGEVSGAIAFADPLRPEAAEAVAALHRRGVGTLVVSGDAQETVDAVIHDAGIAHGVGDVLPQDKERALRETAPAESWEPGDATPFAFVGDGVNDAAALSAADLAIAMPDASDVAQLGADVVLLDRARPLMSLPALMDLARATRRVTWQNLAWAFSYNLVTVPLAAMGLLSPVSAAIAMALSSLAVVANSWRLRFAGGTSARD